MSDQQHGKINQDVLARVEADIASHEKPAEGARLTRDSLRRALGDVETRDATTAAHTWRVVLYTKAMCEAAGLDPATIERACEGAALHDIGKLDVPINILQKPGSLTEREFSLMQEHPLFGHARLIADGVEDELILNLVRYHHERIDGLGYPYKLKDDNIPLIARYFAVIDSFDALTSIRPYRKEIGTEAGDRAIRILQEETGSRYCPEAVALFTELYRSHALDHIMDYFNRDIPFVIGEDQQPNSDTTSEAAPDTTAQ